MSRSNRDHAKKTHRPMVEDEAIDSQLEALLTPAITSQENYYRQLGLRDRVVLKRAGYERMRDDD